MMEPTNGTKRISPARMPHSTALGTPMSQSPPPMNKPNPALRMVCIRKKRLSRAAASSSAAVLRWRSAVPARRRKRSRISSRCSRMNIRKRTARAVVARGDSKGRTTLAMESRPFGSGWRTSTSRGFWPDVAVAPRLGDLVLEVLQRVGSPLQRARHQRSPAQRPYLGAQIGLVLGKLIGELGDLQYDGRAKGGNDGDRHQHRDNDRGNAPQAPAAQAADERRQNEAEQCRDHQRLEDFPTHIEKQDDKASRR